MQVTIIIAQFILSSHSPYKTIDYSIGYTILVTSFLELLVSNSLFCSTHDILSLGQCQMHTSQQNDIVRLRQSTTRDTAQRGASAHTWNFLSRSDNSHIDQVLTFITTGRVTVETGVTPISVAVITAVVITAIYSVVVRPEVSGLTRNCVKEKR